MNITNAVSEEFDEFKLHAIFARQRELMDKYHDIELKSGLMQTEDDPLDLNDKRAQARIKDFAWRVTEEIGEALDSYIAEDDLDHFKEELVDGLHFLTEMTILVGLTPEDFAEHFDVESNQIMERLLGFPFTTSVPNAVMEFVRRMGMTCNCLKNKPWKQSQMLTDKNKFYNNLFSAWKAYFFLLSCGFSDAQEVTDIYLKKSQVNKFRQRSNY